MSRPTGPDPCEHAPHCDQPWMEWQAEIMPGLPIRGRCINCGALDVRRPERQQQP